MYRGETSILLNDIFELQMPLTTADVILPVPIKPSFINIVTLVKEFN